MKTDIDDDNKHDNNLSNREVYVITICNTGLGFKVALDLANRKVSSLIGFGNATSGESALSTIRN